MQQRLGGDAADVQAHAAQHRPAFDQRHLEPQVGGPKSRGVAAHPGAEHDQIDGARRQALRSAGAAAGSRGQRARPRRGARSGGRRGGGTGGRRGAAPARPAVAAASATSTVAISAPADTSSPFLISMDSTTPLTGEGTSIEAFSVSSVISGSSMRISLPFLIRTSTTLTPLASPRSGTRTSTHAHSNALTSPSTLARNTTKRAASAPSITR